MPANWIRFFILCAILGLVLSFCMARGQETAGEWVDKADAQTREMVDAEGKRNNAQDADISRLMNEFNSFVEQAQAEHQALSDRVLALEEAGPVEPDPPDPPDPHPAPGPDPSPEPSDGPLMQANPSWVIWNPETEPFLNLLKAGGGWYATGKNQDNIEFTSLIDRGLINPETLMPLAIPDGYDTIQSGRMRSGASDFPEYFAGKYCIEWEGEAKIRFGLGMHKYQESEGERRLCAEFPETERTPFTVRIEKLETLESLIVFRIEDEERLKSGETWSPAWIKAHEGYAILRDLDIQYIPEGWRTGGLNTPYESALWSLRSNLGPDDQYPNGPPLQAVFELANESGSALWHVMPAALGADPQKLQEIIGQSSWRDRERMIQEYPEAHAAEIADSPKWKAYADHIVRSMIRANYPKNKPFYAELGNEVWNSGPPFGTQTNYFSGMAEGLESIGRLDASGHEMRKSYGWLSAQMATYIDQALKEQGRADQPVRYVLASQNAWDARTEDSLKGFIQYFEMRGEDPAPWLAKVGVSTASYFYDERAFDLEQGIFPASSTGDRDALWLAAIRNDSENLKERLTQRALQSIEKIIAQRVQQQKMAEEYGAFFLGDYEGHDHISPPDSLIKHADFINWFEEWRAGPHGGRLTKAWADGLYAQNPEAVISNYFTIGARDPQGANEDCSQMKKCITAGWVDGFYTEESERQRALDDLRR